MKKIIFFFCLLMCFGTIQGKNLYGQNNADSFCKWCGQSSPSFNLVNFVKMSCQHSPNGKHEIYEGTVKYYYFCKWCGTKRNKISDFIGYNNCKRSPFGRHEPYEGSEKTEYVCKHCGKKARSIEWLCKDTGPCINGKHHEPKI